MTNTGLYNKISMLPPDIKNELLDYMEFLIQKHQAEGRGKHPKAGCMKGTFVMSPDFNAPLEDF